MRQRRPAPATLLAVAAAASLSGATSVRAQTLEPSHPTAVSDKSGEAKFRSESAAAMDKMMSGMAVKPSRDVDADFAVMMIAHHMGAIDMALAELRYGKNEKFRRIAQGIIVEQQQEIVAMRLALGRPPPK